MPGEEPEGMSRSRGRSARCLCCSFPGGSYEGSHTQWTGVSGARAWGFCLSRRVGARAGRDGAFQVEGLESCV